MILQYLRVAEGGRELSQKEENVLRADLWDKIDRLIDEEERNDDK